MLFHPSSQKHWELCTNTILKILILAGGKNSVAHVLLLVMIWHYFGVFWLSVPQVKNTNQISARWMLWWVLAVLTGLDIVSSLARMKTLGRKTKKEDLKIQNEQVKRWRWESDRIVDWLVLNNLRLHNYSLFDCFWFKSFERIFIRFLFTSSRLQSNNTKLTFQIIKKGFMKVI